MQRLEKINNAFFGIFTKCGGFHGYLTSHRFWQKEHSIIQIMGHDMTAPVTLYGIRSCDTMRKARAWLDDHGVAYVFHDYRKDGVPEEHLKRWVDQLGWKALLNQSGTTFRRLPQEKKGSLTAEKAMTLMLEQPAMIRRPVLERPGAAPITGFKPELYERIFASGV